MLDQPYGPYLTFLFIIALLGGAIFAGFAAPPSVPTNQQHVEAGPAAQQSKGDQRGTPEAPLVVETHEGAPTPEIAAQQAEDREAHASAERWIAKGTVAIAAFTVALVFATLVLAWRTWQQEQHFKVSERAYIKMSHLGPKDKQGKPALEFNDARMPSVTLKITNHGRTPGTAIETRVTSRVLPHGQLPTRDCSGPNTVKSAGAFLVTEDTYFISPEFPALSVEEKRAVDGGARDLWIYGYVDYVDQFRQRYPAGYGRFYHRDAISGINLVTVPSDLNYDEEQPKEG
jgi:hypothetical protein